MKRTTFDIETAPDEEAVRRLTKIPPPPSKDFDEDDPFVAEHIGTKKKPESVRDATDKAREGWDEYVESYPERCEATIEQAMDKAALDPRYSRICAVGVTDGKFESLGVEPEYQLLEKTWTSFHGQVSAGHTLCFYSGNNNSSVDTMFDYKFLIHRSRVLKVNIPDWARPSNGRMPFTFRDLAIDYLGTWKYNEYRSVDACAKELGLIGGEIKSKDDLTVTGKDFYKEIDENYWLSPAGEEYLLNDIRLEHAIGGALQL